MYDDEADWYTRLIECGWEEQADGSWILPGEIEWGMALHAAWREQLRRDQWQTGP